MKYKKISGIVGKSQDFKKALEKILSDFGEDFKKALEKILVYLRHMRIIRKDNRDYVVSEEVKKGEIRDIYACDVIDYISLKNLNS